MTFPEHGPFNFVLYNDSEHPISGFYLGRYKERRLIPSLLNDPVPFQKMRDDGEVVWLEQHHGDAGLLRAS